MLTEVKISPPLSDTARSAKLVIVIDALDEFETLTAGADDEQNALFWLPASFPASVRVIVSAVADGAAAVALRKRGSR